MMKLKDGVQKYEDVITPKRNSLFFKLCKKKHTQADITPH
jgi:hypothetical protein